MPCHALAGSYWAAEDVLGAAPDDERAQLLEPSLAPGRYALGLAERTVGLTRSAGFLAS